MIKAIYCLKKKPLLSDAEFISRFQQQHQTAFYRFAEQSGADSIQLSFSPTLHDYQGFVCDPCVALDALIEIHWQRGRFDAFCQDQNQGPKRLDSLFASLGGLVNLSRSQVRLLTPEATLYP